MSLLFSHTLVSSLCPLGRIFVSRCPCLRGLKTAHDWDKFRGVPDTSLECPSHVSIWNENGTTPSGTCATMFASSPSDSNKVPKLHSLDHPSRNGTASHSHRSKKCYHQPSTRRTSKCRNHSLQNGGPSSISPSKLPSMVQLVNKSHSCSHGSTNK